MQPREINIANSLLPMLLGTSVGIFIVYATGHLPNKWLMFFILLIVGATSLICIHVFTRQTKNLLLFGSFMMIPVFYDITFFYQERIPYYVSANGITITLSDVLLFPLIFRWVLDFFFAKEESNQATFNTLPTITAFLLLLLALNALSGLVAPEPFFAYSAIYWYVKMIIIFLFLSNNLNESFHFRYIGYVFVVLMLMQGIVVLEQKFVGAIFTAEFLGRDIGITSRIGQELLTRPGGTLGHPNGLAMFLNMLLPTAIFLFFQEKVRYRKTLMGIGILLALMALVWTASRGGWLGLTAGLVTAMTLWRHKKGESLIRILATTAFAGIFVFMALFAGSSTFRDRLTKEDHGTAEERIPLAQVATNVISHNPWIGVGVNNYTYVMQQYDQTSYYITRWYNLPVHNTYLLMAAETGIPSAVIFVCFLIILIVTAARLFLRMTGVEASAALGILASLIAWAIHNLADFTAIYMDSMLWLLFSMLGALAITQRARERRQLSPMQ